MSLTFHDADGDVTLTGTRWRGYRGSDVVVGRLDAQVAIFGKALEPRPDYVVSTLRSRIDGLYGFAGFRSVRTDNNRTDGSWRTVVTLHAKDEVQLEHDGVTYTLKSAVPSSSTATGFHVQDDALIQTTSQDGMTVEEHVVAQWPLRALLTLAFGAPLFWREHKIRDDQFPILALSGDVLGVEPVPVLYARTVGDHERPAVKRSDLQLPVFTLEHLGPEGLARWLDLYADPVFSRAVEPAVEVLNGGSGDFVEPKLTLVVFALEALGHYLDRNRTVKARLHQQIKRCLDIPGVDWRGLGTADDISVALANVANDMKHPDRGHRPGVEMGLAANLGLAIFRLKIAHLLGVDQAHIEHVRGYPSLRDPVDVFKRNGFGIDKVDGKLRFAKTTS